MQKFRHTLTVTTSDSMVTFVFYPENPRHGFSLVTETNSIIKPMNRQEYLKIMDMGFSDGSPATCWDMSIGSKSKEVGNQKISKILKQSKSI